MRQSRLVLAFLAAVPAAVGAADLEVRHPPLTCVAADRYVRVTAAGVPEWDVAGGEVHFRVGPEGGWYVVDMALELGKGAEGWAAVVPRPLASLSSFEYFVVMKTARMVEVATAPVTVRVGGAECAGDGLTSLTSSVVVHVPPGAPLVPPVPAGFSPAGAVSAQERAPQPPHRRGLYVGGAAVVGAIGAVVVAGLGSTEITVDIPEFAFNGTLPNPATVLSVSRTPLLVFVRMSRQPNPPLTFTWRFEMQRADGLACAVMGDVFREASDPLDLTLTAPLAVTGACGERFDVASTRLTIDVRDDRVYDMTLTLPFHVEP